jgi:hypothetical protein
MARDFQPARRIRSVSPPPSASHWWAKVCRRPVGVQVRETSLVAAAFQHLRQPRGRQPALLAQPQPVKVRLRVTGTSPQVAVQRQCGRAAERQRPLPAALAQHQQHVQVEVHVRKPEAGELAAAGAGVQQQRDDGGISAGLEALAGASRQQPAQAVLGHDRDGLLGHDRRLHPRHRVGLDLLLFLQPAVQDAQDLVAGWPPSPAPAAAAGHPGTPPGRRGWPAPGACPGPPGRPPLGGRSAGRRPACARSGSAPPGAAGTSGAACSPGWVGPCPGK